MASHSDDLLYQLLQKMLTSLEDNKEVGSGDSSCNDGELSEPDESESMLVFKDLKGQVWQISKVDD